MGWEHRQRQDAAREARERKREMTLWSTHAPALHALSLRCTEAARSASYALEGEGGAGLVTARDTALGGWRNAQRGLSSLSPSLAMSPPPVLKAKMERLLDLARLAQAQLRFSH